MNLSKRQLKEATDIALTSYSTNSNIKVEDWLLANELIKSNKEAKEFYLERLNKNNLKEQDT